MLNKQEVLISVIVPVFNAARFLERCLDSVLQQYEKNVEVIVIDDGSTDDSLSLLEKYQALENVRVIAKANGGVSSARNTGLTLAKGHFICFLDADDYLPQSALSTYVSLMTEDVAMIVGESQSYSHNGDQITHHSTAGNQRTLPTADAINDILYFKPKYGVCDKIFLGSIIRAHKLTFNEKIANFEDLLFVMNYLHYTENKKVIFTDEIIYNYTESENSATRSALKEKHFSFATSFLNIKKYLTDKNDRYYYHIFLKVTASYIYKALYSEGFNRKFINKYIAMYRRNFLLYLSSGIIINMATAYLMLFFLSPRLVSHLRKIKQKNNL